MQTADQYELNELRISLLRNTLNSKINLNCI
jgi:hypothetical protein